MRNEEAIKQAQLLLHEFVEYAQEEHLIDMDILIRGMKEFVHSYEAKKKSHRSVQSQVCRGNLAWTTNSLSSPDLSSSVLFFVTDSSMNTVKEDSEYVGLRCIICNSSIQMEVKRNGKLTRNTYVLKNHLDSVHYGLSASISSLYPTMAHLLKDYNWDNATGESDFSVTEQKRIHHFFAKSKEVPTTSEDKVPNQKKNAESSQDQERRVFIPGETERKRNKQVLATILLGIPIAWDTNGDQCLKDTVGALSIPSYHHIKNALSDLISKYQSCVKKYLEGFPFLSLCCDGWSVVKPAKSMEVFFATVFKDNVFKSVLIDCVSMDRSASTDLVDKLEMIQKEYNLAASAMITTDGASNNKKAFEDQRAICSAHAISTVIAHMTSNCRHYSGEKNGVAFEDLKLVREHFRRINTVCTYLTGSKARDYKQFVEAYRFVNTDVEYSKALPERIAPTRWLGVAVQMRWILKHGLLFYRFVISSHEDKFNWLCSFFAEIEESTYVVFMLERAMNLLTPSNKPTLHLVLPVRETMKKCLQSFKPQTEVGMAMKAMLNYELTEGCLTIPKGTYYDYCCAASVLYPGMFSLIPESPVAKWIERANSLLLLKKAEWEDKKMNVCTDRGMFFDLSSFQDSMAQSVSLPEGLLRETISPLKTDCQVVGIDKDKITTLFLDGITDLSINKKTMAIDKVQNELEEAERKLKKLEKQARVIKETSKRVVEVIREEEQPSKRPSKKERDAKRMEKARSAKRSRLMDNPYLNTLSLQQRLLDEESSGVRKRINNLEVELERKKQQLDRMLNQDKEIEVDDVEEEMEEEEIKFDCMILYSFEAFSWNQTVDGLRNPVQCLLETVLSVPATEAVCERFFRQTSLTVKRQYVTNMNDDTLRSIAMIKYKKDVFYAICYGKDVLSVLSFVCWEIRIRLNK